MRAKRSPLEEIVAQATIEAVIATNPGLRDSIRAALDGGATPATVRKRWGIHSPLGKRNPGRQTALAVEWIVDEWQRENGQIKADESIDQLEV